MSPSTRPSIPAASPPATLAAVDLGCRRGNRLLFKGLNFELHPGQARWLRGRNGSGKTSLLRLAASLAQPDTGRITWGGVPVRHATGYARQMSYVGHANGLKDDLTLTESLRFLARLHECDASAAAVHAALDRLGLADRREAPVRTLSQGQRRRGALARLALDGAAAALWILDEPYDALDADGVARVDRLLREHVDGGGSLLLTSHQPPGPGAPGMAETDLGAFA